MKKRAATAHPASKTGPIADDFSGRLSRHGGGLTRAMRRVADFIDQNRPEALTCSAAELARRTDASDATIIRTAQALGFDSLAALRKSLAGSLGGPVAPVEQELLKSLHVVGKDVDLAIARVIGAQQEGLRALQSKKMRALVVRAIAILNPARRIAVFGMGPTGHIASYFCDRLRRNGRRQVLLNFSGGRLADQLLDLEPGDALLMLAYGKPYGEAIAAVEESRRLKIPVVLISDSLEKPLAAQADLVVPAPRNHRGRLSLHGTTVACLEAIAFGLAACDPDRAAHSVHRLSALRAKVAKG